MENRTFCKSLHIFDVDLSQKPEGNESREFSSTCSGSMLLFRLEFGSISIVSGNNKNAAETWKSFHLRVKNKSLMKLCLIFTTMRATKVMKAVVRGRLREATKGMKSAAVGPTPCFSSRLVSL